MTEMSFEAYRNSLATNTRGPSMISEVEQKILDWLQGLTKLSLFPTSRRKEITYSKKGFKTIRKFTRLFARVIFEWELKKTQGPTEDETGEFTEAELEEWE